MRYLYQGQEFTTPEEIYKYQQAIRAAIIKNEGKEDE